MFQTPRGPMPASNLSLPAHAGRGAYQAANPQVAAWLDHYPDVAEVLAVTDAAMDALGDAADGAYAGTQKARRNLDDARAAKSRYLYDQRDAGQAPDADTIKRLDANIEAAAARNEAAFARSDAATAALTSTRNASNPLMATVNGWAASDADVRLFTDEIEPFDGDIKSAFEELDVREALIASALLEEDHAVELSRQRVGELAQRGILVGVTSDDVTIRAKRVIMHVAPLVGSEPITIDDPLAIVAALFEEQLGDYVEKVVRSKYAGGIKGLSAAERRDALAELADDRFDLMRRVAKFVKGEWAKGNFIGMPASITPEALLGGVTVIPRKKDGPVTSLIRNVIGG